MYFKAFPLISSGGNRYPRSEAVRIAVAELLNWLATYDIDDYVTSIILVGKSNADYRLLQDCHTVVLLTFTLRFIGHLKARRQLSGSASSTPSRSRSTTPQRQTTTMPPPMQTPRRRQLPPPPAAPSPVQIRRPSPSIRPQQSSSTSDRLLSKLKIVTGNIVHQHVDVVVNSANNRLQRGGGVDNAIHDACAPETDILRQVLEQHTQTGLAGRIRIQRDGAVIETPAFGNLRRTMGVKCIIIIYILSYTTM